MVHLHKNTQAINGQSRRSIVEPWSIDVVSQTEFIETRAPAVCPNVFHRANQVTRYQRPVVRHNAVEWIERNHMLGVRGIEDNYIVNTPARYQGQKCFGQITMRINDGASFAVDHILGNKLAQKCRFADTGLANNVKVPQSIQRQ